MKQPVRAALGSHSSTSSSGSSSTDSEEIEEMSPWIEWYLSQPQNDFFCEVEEEYILDRFNLTGLTSAGPHFQQAIDRITMNDEDFFEEQGLENTNDLSLSNHSTVDVEDNSQKVKQEIQSSASHLYGLIHARYIITTQGLNKMVKKMHLCFRQLNFRIFF